MRATFHKYEESPGQWNLISIRNVLTTALPAPSEKETKAFQKKVHSAALGVLSGCGKGENGWISYEDFKGKGAQLLDLALTQIS